jgi:hypothetical protein
MLDPWNQPHYATIRTKNAASISAVQDFVISGAVINLSVSAFQHFPDVQPVPKLGTPFLTVSLVEHRNTG